MPRILGLDTKGFDACVLYRMALPLHELNRRGWENVVMTYDRARETQLDPSGFDAVLFQRITNAADETAAMSKFADHLARIRDLGPQVWIDYDDDWSARHRKIGNRKLDEAIMAQTDAVIVSTPELRKVMLEFHDRVYDIPNLLAPEMFAGHERILDGLVIALTGSFSHNKDWQVVYGPLRRLLKKHSGVRLLCAGYIPDDLRDICLTPRDLGFDGDAVGMRDYPKLLANSDIVLAPVDPADRFSWSKTELKAVEGMFSARVVRGVHRAGCAIVATGGELPVYHRCIEHGRTGLLVQNHGDEGEWEAAIERLILDQSFRERLQIAGHKYALSKYSIHDRIHERERLFLKLLKQRERVP